MTIGKKIIMMLMGLTLTTLATGLLYFFTLSGQAESLLKGIYNPVSIKGVEETNEVIEATDPLTILFMGVDTGSGSRSDEWAGNSDTMILVTVNPKTKTTTMMSLERDILVNLSNSTGDLSGSQTKLNAAYQEGEIGGAISTIQNLMNITIDKYVMINMQGMVDLVNAVDGITVNNKLGFTISIAEQEPEYTATIDPGEQNINGEQALVYARMRYQDPIGDYGRQQRQREVIEKIIEKVISMDSLSYYQDILEVVSENIQTNIPPTTTSIQQLLGYQDALKNIKSYQLTGVDAMFNETSYQIVTQPHLLEMQNILQTSLGKEKYTSLKTSAILYEDVYGYSAETPDYSGESTGAADATTDTTTETAVVEDYSYGY